MAIEKFTIFALTFSFFLIFFTLKSRAVKFGNPADSTSEPRGFPSLPHNRFGFVKTKYVTGTAM